MTGEETDHHRDDPHFAVHRYNSSEYAPTTASSEEEHPLPQRLTSWGQDGSHPCETIDEGGVGRSSATADGATKPAYGADPEKDAVPRRDSVSRTSVRSTRSARTNASGYSVREIYGDISPEELELQRETTRQTVLAQLSRTESRHYTESAQIENDGEDNVVADGSEFRDFDPELVAWEGPDDPENPRNWTARKKWVTTSLVSLYTFVSPLSSSILSPSVPLIADSFGVGDSTILKSLMVSIFLLAWAICPLFIGPFSELWGRRIVLNVSIVLLLIFNVACGLAQTTAQMCVFRFLAGMAGAPPISVGAGALADMFADDERNMPLALYSMGPQLGPVVAPIIAGWITMSGHWRWVFWALCFINGAVAAVGLIFYQETFSPVLLKWKAQKLRKETGNANLHTVFELTEQSFWKRLRIAVSRPITLLLTHPIILGLGLYMAFVYGFMYLMIVEFPSLWETYYNYSTGISGLMYLGLGIGEVLSIFTWTYIVDWKYRKLIKVNDGIAKPEYRIALVVYTSIVLAIGLFWYGWSAEARVMWLMPVIGTGIFGWGLFPVFLCVQNYLIDMNPRYSASSVGAAAVFRSFFGFGFPLFGTAMYSRLGYGWANTLCGILCIILGAPFPFFIYKYGERVRAWTDKKVGHLHSK